ncbi:DUF4377 domain-containing protein [Christiangramia sp. SM2212]|uniref:DUF4377 domain-containing protein n=1 Tax=Christiangramia sediminicola TaxID=3073267 RepID=A0ABU1ENR4_9FLAO|nr:DUF4377 domain-containing protein [Christiangramia sp. SM2212]MDR5590036.1 DUF4377 domain-containing protein [Christiangramia sp. SM2212]
MYFKVSLMLIVGILTSFFSVSCSIKGNPPGKPEMVDLRINHFRQTAMGEGPYLVYLIQESEDIGGENWGYLYDGIEGFEYELGYVYDLKVKKITLENPPADGSSIKYILVNVRHKEKAPVNAEFDIQLKAYNYNFVTMEDDDIWLLNTYSINCNILCESFLSELETSEQITGTFIHGPEENLVLQSYR